MELALELLKYHKNDDYDNLLEEVEDLQEKERCSRLVKLTRLKSCDLRGLSSFIYMK